MKVNNATPAKTTINNTPTMGNKPALKWTKEAHKLLTLDRRGPMGRNLVTLAAFTFLLGSRLVTSRDKDEIRETMIRDVPTIVIAIMGVPMASKWIATKLQNHTGFALVHETEKSDMQKWRDNLFGKKGNITTSEATYDKLASWYQYNDKSATGFKGFTDRLAGLNGNLKKIYSTLGDEFKAKLEMLPNDNKGFTDALFKDKSLLQEVTEAFKSNKNGALQKALFNKTITKITGFSAILTLVGFCIPKGNILLTNILHRGDKAKKEDDKKTSA